MKSDELQRARTSVLSSPLLSQSEKAEWVQLLPSMNDVQVAELMEILSSAAKPAARANVPAPAAAPAKPVVPAAVAVPAKPQPVPVQPPKPSFHLPDLNEKDLPSAPTVPELPPKPIAQVKPMATVVTPMVGASLDQILHREKPVQSIPPSQPAQPAKPVQPARPVQPINPQQVVKPSVPAPHSVPMASVLADTEYDERRRQAAATAAAYIPQPTMPKQANEHITVAKPDDLTKLTPGYLHDQDPQLVLAQLLKIVSEFTKTYKFTDLLGKVEQSPLYQAYFRLGMALLNDASTDRNAIYQNFQRTAASHGEGSLSKEEFEAFTDFRRALDRILV